MAFFQWFDLLPLLFGMLGADCFYTCHLFPVKSSPYFFQCYGTCWNRHFSLLVHIMGYLNYTTPNSSFSNPRFWKFCGIAISSFTWFFYGPLTRIRICDNLSRCSFGCHMNMSSILCKSNHGHSVISMSYHIYIPFFFHTFLGFSHPIIAHFSNC